MIQLGLPLQPLNALLLLDCSICGREALLLVLDLDGHSLAVGRYRHAIYFDNLSVAPEGFDKRAVVQLGQ